MGFFKAQRDLLKQAKEIDREMGPVGDRLANAQARMAAATQNLAAQTASANAALNAQANGISTNVTISAVRQTGMINFDAMLQIDAMVMPDGAPPYPVSISQTVPQIQLGMLQPGTTLVGKVDPQNRNAVWLDLMTLR